MVRRNDEEAAEGSKMSPTCNDMDYDGLNDGDESYLVQNQALEVSPDSRKWSG